MLRLLFFWVLVVTAIHVPPNVSENNYQESVQLLAYEYERGVCSAPNHFVGALHSHDACDKLPDLAPLVKNAQDELRPARLRAEMGSVRGEYTASKHR